MKEMIGGCCVCGDERGWTENPLVYCDGQGCNVAVHQGKKKETSSSRCLKTKIKLMPFGLSAVYAP